MPVRSAFHALSRSISPAPKSQRTSSDTENDSGYVTPRQSAADTYRDQQYLVTPDASSAYTYSSSSTAVTPHQNEYNGGHEERVPALPPRKMPDSFRYESQSSIPQIEVNASDVKKDEWSQQDYAPPPGPPPSHLIGSVPPPYKNTLTTPITPTASSSFSSSSLDVTNLGAALPSLPQRPKTVNGALPKPIAIPSVNTDLGSPYMRAYPPSLHHFGIPQTTFLRFLDRLNRVAAANPPIVMLGLGASVVGLIPEPTTAMIATAVEATCELTVYAMSKGRTEMLLREANRDLFGPRGLKVQLAKLEAVAKLAGIPVLDEKGKLMSSKSEKKNSEGTATMGTRVLAPLEDVHELHNLSAQHRRVRALAPWTMPLAFEDLPDEAAVAQDGDFDEISETGGNDIGAMGKLHQYVNDYQRKTGEEKLIKGRKKALDRLSEKKQKAHDKHAKKLRDLDKEEAHIREKIAKKKSEKDGTSSTVAKEEKLEKIAVKRTLDIPAEYEKDMEKIQREYGTDDKEEKEIRRVHYLIVTDKDDVEGQTEDGELSAEEVGKLAAEGKMNGSKQI